MPKFTCKNAAHWVVSQWSGGKTTQLAIAPDGAVYQNRNFLWRLSSATVELEQSDFTPLPDYTRLISVLKGGMTLCPEGQEPVSLAPFEVYSFDGATPVLSKGRCTDFNLMLRKGRCEGSLQTCCMGEKSTLTLTAAIPSPLRYAHRTVAIYCAEGGASVEMGGIASRVEAGGMLLCEDVGTMPLQLVCTAPTALMLAEIWD